MACMIMAVLMGGVMTAFMGSRKSQGMSVTQSLMKVEGQRLFKKLYVELGQVKRLLGSASTAPIEEDIGLSYYMNLDIPSDRITKMPDANMRFPRVAAGGLLTNLGTGDGQMNPRWIGNALIFVTRDKLLSLATPGVNVLMGGSGLTRPLREDKPFRLNTYKFICYFLDERVKGADEPKINGVNHTYGLMRFESQPYVEKSELEGFFGRIPVLGEKLTVWKEIKDVHGVTRAFDINQSDATQAIYDVDASATLVQKNELIARKHLQRAIDLKLEPYAKGFIAFNTTSGTFKPSDLNDKQGLDVPRFGEEQDIVPYGFEVSVTGPNSARSVMLRLGMAARLNQGGHIYGQSQQTIVQVVDN